MLRIISVRRAAAKNRRLMMADWATFCGRVEQEGGVIDMRRKSANSLWTCG
jgi:hypothetical protein